ncbi:MAG: ACT domain-containing protein [Spirochaetaceae bacterium]|nr:ACT domain-containing protein [Spirochaetaceae bacterium]RKX89293.1 MAG: amino acid-binding protein [Spirochaetota bacterium]RKX98861.1 MAG: amino acid-binding protein [Spirochaetota bacterium]
MKVTQISVFMENKNGRLAEITKLLASKNISLRAVTIADTADFGILRLIVKEPDRTRDVLLEAGFTARETDVLAVAMEDKPGALADVMELFEKNNVNIEYLYSILAGKGDKADIVFRVEDLERGQILLKQNGYDRPLDL